MTEKRKGEEREIERERERRRGRDRGRKREREREREREERERGRERERRRKRRLKRERESRITRCISENKYSFQDEQGRLTMTGIAIEHRLVSLAMHVLFNRTRRTGDLCSGS